MIDSILLVDHDETTSAILQQKFQIKGCKVASHTNGQEVISTIQQFAPDCIVLEVGLPDIDGPELCRTIKAHSDIPVIFHTNCNNDQDEIRALLAGADDYVAKSKRFEVLYQRMLRLVAARGKDRQDEFSIGQFFLKKSSFQCSFNGKKIPLSNDEFELLYFFLKNSDKLISREELFVALKNKNYDGKSRSFDTCIFRLQLKLRNMNLSNDVFSCIRGKGYVLNKSKLAKPIEATV